MKKVYIFLLLCLFIPAYSVWATHIVGGEFELHSKGTRSYDYTLTLNLYFDDINGNVEAEDTDVLASIFSKRTNQLIAKVTLLKIGSSQVSYTNPACVTARLRTRLIQYSQSLVLSPSVFNDQSGYYVVWDRCCRNGAIANIDDPGGTGMSFYMEFPAVTNGTSKFENSSPVFTVPKGDYACVNEPFIFDFGATDPDSDVLVYSLVTPYRGYSSRGTPKLEAAPGPYPTISWISGIDLNNVIPGLAPLRVDSKNGQLSFTANMTGLYVFSVLCEEYRNNKKIGEVRRDFQLMVIDCPKNDAPTVKLKEPGKSDFYQEGQVITIKSTDSRCMDIFAMDVNGTVAKAEQLTLQLRPINFGPEEATLSPTSGVITDQSDSLRVKLCWSQCAESKPGEPFLFEIIVSDKGCPTPKRDTLQVMVNVELPPNDLPDIRTTLPNNAAIVFDKNSLTFNVIGTDVNQDMIEIKAQGRGFDLATLGMSFAGGSATGTVTSPFVWQPVCDAIQDGQTYTVDFTVTDKRCPGHERTNTVSVNLQFKSRPNQAPTVTTDLPGNQGVVFIDKEIKFNVTAEESDENDPIVLKAIGRGFTLEEMGMQFQNGAGIKKLTQPFLWKPTCEALKKLENNSFVIDFITEDNSCATNRMDTVTVTIDLKDYELPQGTEFLPPNVFSPNHDGKNDFFHIPNLPPDNCRDQFERIEIYNRWGKVVFEGNNREFQWSGVGFPTGIYFYLIKYRNSTYKGSVSLLR
jgi:gliding motility-associated-like protein